MLWKRVKNHHGLSGKQLDYLRNPEDMVASGQADLVESILEWLTEPEDGRPHSWLVRNP